MGIHAWKKTIPRLRARLPRDNRVRWGGQGALRSSHGPAPESGWPGADPKLRRPLQMLHQLPLAQLEQEGIVSHGNPSCELRRALVHCRYECG